MGIKIVIEPEESEEPSVPCAKCGAEVEAEDNYCCNCGAKAPKKIGNAASMARMSAMASKLGGGED